MGFFLFDWFFGFFKPRDNAEKAVQNAQDVAPKLREEISRLKAQGKHKEALHAEEELAKLEMHTHKQAQQAHQVHK